MTDDRWMLDKIFQLEREAGASEARLDGHDEAIDRIESAVKAGIAELKGAQETSANHLRGEIKATADTLAQAIGEVKQERADFQRALSRVGWAIIAAVVAAAAAQTALSPQVAGIAARALSQIQ